MRVILLQDVLHQGKRGEVIDVKPGFARNFLLPQGIALAANDGNLKRFEQLKQKLDAKHFEASEEAQVIAGSISLTRRSSSSERSRRR